MNSEKGLDGSPEEHGEHHDGYDGDGVADGPHHERVPGQLLCWTQREVPLPLHTNNHKLSFHLIIPVQYNHE